MDRLNQPVDVDPEDTQAAVEMLQDLQSQFEAVSESIQDTVQEEN